MNEDKQKDNSQGFWWIVFGIVLIILFWGLGSENKSPRRKKVNRIPKPLLKKPEQLDQRKQLQELNKLLDSKKSALEYHRKRIGRIILWSRIIIGLLLVTANVIFFFLLNFSESGIRIELQVNQLTGNQLNFNEAILLFYSFFALVLYGTPRKFVAVLKYRITKKMQTAHSNLSEEIKLIEKEIVNVRT